MSHLLTAIITALALYGWQSNHAAQAEADRNARLIKIVRKISASVDRTTRAHKSARVVLP